MRIETRIKNKGESAFTIWLTALASIFVVMLFYLIFNQVFYSSYGLVEIVNSSFSTTPSINLTEPLRTMTLINQIWSYFPIVAILGILVWAISASVKSGEAGGYAG